MTATNILSWESTDGTERSILFVVDQNKRKGEVGHKKLEICEYDSSEDEWETIETIDSVYEFEGYGIPSELID